jgi:benzoyl-CoA reductase/2-hydroxyglutaryl-CoA dehydratase subunit BcrC/BadD/HgdB
VTALDRLRHHYVHRFAAATDALAHGTSVVGRIGPTVPIELVLASGRLPTLVAADLGSPTPVAEMYMEPVIPPETKSLFDIATGGELQGFELLVLSRPYAQLYYYLKEVYRLGRAPKLPPLHMHDVMQSRREAVRAYNWQQLQDLCARLNHLPGRPVAEDSLRAAIVQTNRVRALQRQVIERRWASEIAGVDALRVTGAGYFMAPDLYADTLAAYLGELRPDASLSGRPRLLVLPSEPLSHTYLHQVLEQAGGLVVAEDDWWGSRAAGDDVPPTGSALEGVFLKYWLDMATANVSPAGERESWFVAQLGRPEVDGVVFYLPPSDHQLGWDYPRLKSLVEECGKPALLVRDDAAQADSRDAIAQHVRGWLEAHA